MNKKHSPHKFTNLIAPLVLCSILLVGFSSCKEDVVHQRSISELNEKAQQMMQSGDYEGAVSRLEAAHDLEPDEPNTTHNLAVAYQTKGDYEKAIAVFNTLLKSPGPNGSPMSAAELHKDIGITYEAQADKLEADAKKLEDEPKGDKTKAQKFKQESHEALTQAVSHYKEALPGLKSDAEGIAHQIEAIEAKLKKDSAGAQP